MNDLNFPSRVRGIAERRTALPARATLAEELGQSIDGAWWPRNGHTANELPAFVRFAAARLGDIVSLTVNWPHYQRPPDLNWNGWRDAPQHTIVVQSLSARATVLVIPYETNQTLAQMILCRATRRPVTAAERKTTFFETAGQILDAARRQRIDTVDRPV